MRARSARKSSCQAGPDHAVNQVTKPGGPYVCLQNRYEGTGILTVSPVEVRFLTIPLICITQNM